MAEKLTELHRKRGSVKSKLTTFRKYLDIHSGVPQLGILQLTELRLRLDKIENIYEEFDVYQSEIESLTDDTIGPLKEREEFESNYYSLVASARILLGKHRKQSLPLQSTDFEVGSNADASVSTNTQNFVRLPKIDLPHFSGSYQNWLEFRDTYLSLIHNNDSINAINKFHYLRAALQGSAALIIQSLDFRADNYSVAWQLLSERYDNTRLLVNNHVQALFNVESIQKESSQSLRTIVDITNKNLRALATLGQPTDHWDTLIIFLMSSKLDNITNREWEERRNSLDDPPSLQTFIKFLTNRADLLETLEESKFIKGKSDHTSIKSNSYVVSTNRPKINTCPLCHNPNHFLFNCFSFRKLPVDIRIQKVREFRVCFNCLRPGHSEAQCRLSTCKYCTSKHNTLLHVDKPQEPKEPVLHDSPALSDSNLQLPTIKINDEQQVNAIALSAKNSMACDAPGNVLLSTALVRVFDSEGKPHVARVLLDNGSTANFVTQSLCSKLCLNTSSLSSKVTGINNQMSSSSQSCSLTMESYNGGFKTSINCYILPNITTSIPATYIDIHNIQIPSGIHLADPTFHIPSVIDILVGAEVFWKVIGTNRIDLGKHKPTLFETRFGWLVSGSIHKSMTDPPICMFAQDSTTQQTDLTRFWELDSILPKHNMTSEERACEQNFIDTTTRNSDGRFVVTLPLKESPEVLGDSFQMAKRRFLSLERRLERESTLKQLYVEFLKEYADLGHMSETAETQKGNTVACYLPHHGVLRESSTTTRLRAVFDASAVTTSGKSFNDIQRVGPTIQDDLFSILLRFRQHKFVVSADVEKMYRQIEIVESQRPLQQILWRSDPSHPLKSYTLNTVTYGTSSAPYLATRCLTQLGHDSNDKNIKHAICRDFYVDDFISGGDNKDTTIALCLGVTAALDSAKFNLRKWHSNDSDIIQAVCKDADVSDSVDLSANELSKTLGLNWNCSSDTLNFSINVIMQNKVNKRLILSTIAQVFDPLGLVSPCIVEAKILMQQLWITKCSWDEEVPQHIQKAWMDFSKSLPQLNKLAIPRCIKNESPIDITLHIFTDSSEKAYGTCIYIRCHYSNGSVSVRLLTSKSKVAPIKATTIPRLELCAALLGTRLCSKVCSSLTLNYSGCSYWSDSTIVLGWLASSPVQLTPFVRHRVSEIQETSADNEWHYVPSKENPADLVSRGLSADVLGNSSLWWLGPSFLKLNPSQWPIIPNKETHDSLPEIVKTVKVHAITEEHDILTTLLSQCSKFTKLQRVLAFVFRFISNCKKAKSDRICDALTTQELNVSTNFLLSRAQQDSFPEEYQLLVSRKDLPTKNRLLALSPFMDKNNLIRVGGRLHNSNYDYNIKHPILLCAKHRLCELIFEMYHQRYFHSGPQLLLSTIRHKYWPLGGKNLAKRIVHSCVKCCRLKARTIQPIMGNLPEQRVELEFPFLDTGVDYAGPVTIADRKGRGCKLIKSYICVFVCLATKAVHLELVSDLTKEGFIAALNRFISRRGKPKNIFSDNGGAFVGASNDLKTNTSIIEQDINFSFIPAYTPHFGGLWESAVKSIKHHLRRVLDLTYLTYEEMSTLLIQVEAILNSRPLTPLSEDPYDLCPLTPSHFLIGRSLSSVPHPDVSNARISSLQRFQRIEVLKQHFWKRFSNEYVLRLQQKTRWQRSQGKLQTGAMVVVKDKSSPPLMWLLGRVTSVLPGRDGVARVADIQTKKGIIRRAFNNICPLPVKFETK